MQNLEWLNQNSLRAFPFAEDMQRMPTVEGVKLTGLQLPNSFLLDFHITIPGNGGERVFLSRLVLAGTLVSLTFSKLDGGDAAVGMAEIDVNSNSYVNIILNPTPENPGAEGRIVIGNIASMREYWPDGVYTFERDQTELEFCLVRSASAQLSGIRVKDGDNMSETLTGIVTLVAGQNVRLGYSDDNTITIDAIPGEGYFESCGDCPVSDNIVRTINGIPLRDVVLVSGNDCIEITESGNSITITDKCSTPCCGCEELELATEKLIEFDKLTTDIGEYRNRLQAAVNLLTAALAQVN